MDRKFCDRCEKEIEQSQTEKVFDATSLGQYKVTAKAQVVRKGMWLQAELCLDCIIDLFMTLDSRPRQAERVEKANG